MCYSSGGTRFYIFSSQDFFDERLRIFNATYLRRQFCDLVFVHKGVVYYKRAWIIKGNFSNDISLVKCQTFV